MSYSSALLSLSEVSVLIHHSSTQTSAKSVLPSINRGSVQSFVTLSAEAVISVFHYIFSSVKHLPTSIQYVDSVKVMT